MASPLTEARWRRLEELFLAALELSPADREAFVAREAAGDFELARDLAGMLGQADGGRRIAAAIEHGVATLGVPDDWAGRRCGAYRIVREIGHGGMGLVFEAVRDDDEYHKTVALKMAPFWRDRAGVHERFRLERQILAELEHPNIARFLDGGTEEGIPYFVMEYVEGHSITAYCDERHLDLADRLALFRQVCGAVHFAHERLVVHRDLKPANILVSSDGAPKLLDFGIAKLLDPVAGRDTAVTVETPWTPDYTSPEQVRGRPVTTRTDVYSLGLILYELLTGERAQVADPTSPLALDRSICEQEPLRPSERCATRGDRVMAGRLRGDLDTIVMTAISKEPDRRYGTAAAFGDDVQRYLERQPVLARPSTASYRAAKFLRRHTAGTVATALVVVSLVGGLGAALFEARRADRRFQQVRALANTFVFEVHDRIETLPGAAGARKMIVQTALTYLETLRTEASGDAALARELAAAYERIGNVQGNPLKSNLGDSAGSMASYGRAIDLLTPLSRSGDIDAQRQLTSVLRARADTQRAMGDIQGAIAGYANAESVGEQVLAARPTDTTLLSDLSDTFAAHGRAEVGDRDQARAEALSRRSMELVRRAGALEPANPHYRDTLASAYSALGNAIAMDGRLEEVAAWYRESIVIRETLVRDEPDNTEYRRNLMVSYGNLGDVLGYRVGENLGDEGGAEDAFAHAVSLAEWARQKDPRDRRAESDLVNARLRLGSVIADDMTRIDEGLGELRDADRLVHDLRGAQPNQFIYGILEALIQRRIADALRAVGRKDEAARRLESARVTLTSLMDTPARSNTRSLYVTVTVRLAALRAGAHSREAAALADQASVQLTKGSMGSTFLDATTFEDLGRVYLEVAKRSAPPERTARLEDASRSLEKSETLWRGLKAASAVEASRVKALREVEGLLADCRAVR